MSLGSPRPRELSLTILTVALCPYEGLIRRAVLHDEDDPSRIRAVSGDLDWSDSRFDREER
jgi:hypothetical protein